MPCSIFVGNLPPSISEYDLEDIITTSFNLKGWKLIEDVRVKRTAQGKAFAFVTLSSEQTAHDALTIYNRKISQAICQRYACYGIRLELARRQKTDGMPCSIFVGNLPRSISEFDLVYIIRSKLHYKGWKLIGDVRIKRTAQGKAFAFVTLSSEQTAHDALAYWLDEALPVARARHTHPAGHD